MRIYSISISVVVCCIIIANNLLFAKTESKICQLLDKKLNSFKEFSAKFNQQITDKQNQLIDSSYGEIKIKSPNSFLWKVNSENKIIIINDNKLFKYDIDLEQIIVKHKFDIKNTPIAILTDIKIIKDNYYLRGKKLNNNKYVFTFIPKDKDAMPFNKIIATFVESKIESLLIKDNLEQTTSIQFTNISNKKINKYYFNFMFPEGVDVINQ